MFIYNPNGKMMINMDKVTTLYTSYEHEGIGEGNNQITFLCGEVVMLYGEEPEQGHEHLGHRIVFETPEDLDRAMEVIFSSMQINAKVCIVNGMKDEECDGMELEDF